MCRFLKENEFLKHFNKKCRIHNKKKRDVINLRIEVFKTNELIHIFMIYGLPIAQRAV